MKIFPNLKKKWSQADVLVKEAALLLSIAIILILLFPLIFIQSSPLGIDFNKTGQIGDTIGGILAPFIAIIAAVLTFAAFYVQYQANQIQIRNFKDQMDISNVQRFESKFYDMIKLHIENVNSIFIEDYLGNKIVGKNTFKEFFEELRFTFYLLKQKYGNDLDDINILKISYYIYSYGIVNNILLNDQSLNLSSEKITQIINTFKGELIKIDKYFKDKKAFESKIPIAGQEHSFFLRHRCFSGNMNILGHYYRNLFQTVKYVDKFRTDLQPADRKINYIKTLRAQLSNYEQLLLYYNTLSKFGYPWLNDVDRNTNPKDYSEGYLIKYKMIKNIPLPLADFGIKPEVKFEKEIELLRKKSPPEELFEWHEIAKRN